jgi:hypothetical protein
LGLGVFAGCAAARREISFRAPAGWSLGEWLLRCRRRGRRQEYPQGSDFGLPDSSLAFCIRAPKVAAMERHKAKRKASGGLLVFVGFMLSPLSWWNDAFVNLPLALAFAWLIALFYKPAFAPSVVLGYWLTNVLGFVLMHKGGVKIMRETDSPYSLRHLGRDLIVSLLYTLLIVALIKFKVLQPVTDYFQKK